MNCMKFFGLGITEENYLFVRDHRSRGCPHLFWKHNDKCKSDEHVHWEVGSGDGVDVAERVLKNPIPFCYVDDYDESSSPHGFGSTSSFQSIQGDATEMFSRRGG